MKRFTQHALQGLRMRAPTVPVSNTCYNFQKPSNETDPEIRFINTLKNTITDAYWEDPIHWTPDRKYTAAQARRLWKDRFFVKDKYPTYLDNLGENYKFNTINPETLDTIVNDLELSQTMFYIDIRSRIRNAENPFTEVESVNIPLLEIGEGGAILLRDSKFKSVYGVTFPVHEKNIVFIHDDNNQGLMAAHLWAFNLKWDSDKLFLINAHDYMDIPKKRWMYRSEPLRLSSQQIQHYMKNNLNNSDDE